MEKKKELTKLKQRVCVCGNTQYTQGALKSPYLPPAVVPEYRFGK